MRNRFMAPDDSKAPLHQDALFRLRHFKFVLSKPGSVKRRVGFASLTLNEAAPPTST